MKRRIRLRDNISGKDITGTVEIPAKDHLAAQQKYKAKVFKPKKGRGSFKRQKKHRKQEEE